MDQDMRTTTLRDVLAAEHENREMTTLRDLLADDRQNSAFAEMGAAYIQVHLDAVHLNINAMHRALVAHEALNNMMTCMGQSTCQTFKLAIAKARALMLISPEEQRWLKHFNVEANAAKHRF
jgi:hypothetical protein